MPEREPVELKIVKEFRLTSLMFRYCVYINGDYVCMFNTEEEAREYCVKVRVIVQECYGIEETIYSEIIK